MFDKTAQNDPVAQPQPAQTPAPVSLVNQPNHPASTAVIGESIVVKGEISGDQDLVVNGRVEGSVNLPNHDLQVGDAGRMTADLTANKVQIDGEVNGDITGVEKVIVSNKGRVQGNIVAPRVTLEDGAKFKGSIDMDPSDKAPAANAPKSGDQAEAVKQALREVRKKSASGKDEDANGSATNAKG